MDIWDSANIPRAALNTVMITAVCMILTILTTSMTAYAVSRSDFPGRRVIMLALVTTLLIPGEMLIIPTFYVNRSLHLIGDWKALIAVILVMTAGAQVFNIYLLLSHFLTIPRDLFDSAELDGETYFGAYRRIAFPLITPALATVTLLTFMGIWNAYLVPLVYLGWQLWLAATGRPHDLGREPVEGVEHATGEQAIRFLLISLAVTPVRQLTGWNWLAKYRRVFGLVMFAYASVHLLTYAVLDLELQLGEVATEIAKRPYLVVGFTAWLLLVPLAVTSTTGWIRRLGGRRWNRLHKLAYAAAVLGVVHYWMSQKKDHSEPLLWGAGFLALFAWRWWYARRERTAAR